jgi:hypothetical protein
MGILSDLEERHRLRTPIASKSAREACGPASDSYLDSAGLRKLVSACIQAKHYAIHYVWLDTCAIDKTSSAELQEAINSMYRWYEQSRLCYVYLDDVPADVRWDKSDDELLSYVAGLHTPGLLLAHSSNDSHLLIAVGHHQAGKGDCSPFTMSFSLMASAAASRVTERELGLQSLAKIREYSATNMPALHTPSVLLNHSLQNPPSLSPACTHLIP